MPGPLGVLTYNVWFDESNYEERAQILFGQILEADPDVVALQEVTPRFRKLLDESTLGDQYHIWAEPLSKLKPNGTALLTRWEPTATLHEPFPPPDHDMDRGLLACCLTVPGGGARVWVGTAWLESPEGEGQFDNYQVRKRQWAAMLGGMENAAHAGAAVLLGDMNTTRPEVLPPNH